VAVRPADRQSKLGTKALSSSSGGLPCNSSFEFTYVHAGDSCRPSGTKFSIRRSTGAASSDYRQRGVVHHGQYRAVRHRPSALINVINYQVGSFFYIDVNVGNPLFANKLVRQAMNYTLDRQRISSTVLQGLVGDPVDLPWPNNSPAFDLAKNSTYPFDLDKAAALLKRAGVSNAECEITYSSAGYASEYAGIAQIYQADLAKIGFNTTLKPVDGPTFTQQGLSRTYTGLRIGAGGGASVVDASSLLQGGNASVDPSAALGYVDAWVG
jgi:ABC-type transport system substrate-binding protein